MHIKYCHYAGALNALSLDNSGAIIAQFDMTLNEYLKLHGLSDGDFADLVKRERTTVMRWRKGATRPDWEALEAIHEASGGAVTPNDFFPPDEQPAVAVQ